MAWDRGVAQHVQWSSGPEASPVAPGIGKVGTEKEANNGKKHWTFSAVSTNRVPASRIFITPHAAHSERHCWKKKSGVNSDILHLRDKATRTRTPSSTTPSRRAYRTVPPY